LNDCEARSKNKLNFHFNTSLTAVNLAKMAHWRASKSDKIPFSMSDVETVYNSDLQLNRFIRKFGINPNTPKKNIK
jgi:hypothetical protein